MQTEPRLQEISGGGQLNRALFARIVRRVEHLQEKIAFSRKQAAPPPLREPTGKLRLSHAYLSSITRRVENFYAEIQGQGAKTPQGAGFDIISIDGLGENPEPPLSLNPTAGQFTQATINRLIRRIEHLHNLSLEAYYVPPA